VGVLGDVAVCRCLCEAAGHELPDGFVTNLLSVDFLEIIGVVVIHSINPTLLLHKEYGVSRDAIVLGPQALPDRY